MPTLRPRMGGGGRCVVALWAMRVHRLGEGQHPNTVDSELRTVALERSVGVWAVCGHDHRYRSIYIYIFIVF